MSTDNRTILAEVAGFTPLIDSLIPVVGYLTTGIFGIIWRYCQMEDGICRASTTTLAKKLGLNRRSIMRHVDKLIAAGYLVDETPDAKGKPHRLRDTGKAGLKVKIGVEVRPEGVTKSHTPCDSESHLPVTKSHTKILRKIPSKKQDIARGKPRDPLLDHPAISAYRGIARLTPNPTQRELIAAAVGEEETEVAKWRRVLTEWVGHGWNPHNVTSQLEAYRNGFQTTRKENGNGLHGKAAGQSDANFDPAGQRAALDAIQKRAAARIAPLVPVLSKPS